VLLAQTRVQPLKQTLRRDYSRFVGTNCPKAHFSGENMRLEEWDDDVTRD